MSGIFKELVSKKKTSYKLPPPLDVFETVDNRPLESGVYAAQDFTAASDSENLGATGRSNSRQSSIDTTSSFTLLSPDQMSEINYYYMEPKKEKGFVYFEARYYPSVRGNANEDGKLYVLLREVANLPIRDGGLKTYGFVKFEVVQKSWSLKGRQETIIFGNIGEIYFCNPDIPVLQQYEVDLTKKEMKKYFLRYEIYTRDACMDYTKIASAEKPLIQVLKPKRALLQPPEFSVDLKPVKRKGKMFVGLQFDVRNEAMRVILTIASNVPEFQKYYDRNFYCQVCIVKTNPEAELCSYTIPFKGSPESEFEIDAFIKFEINLNTLESSTMALVFYMEEPSDEKSNMSKNSNSKQCGFPTVDELLKQFERERKTLQGCAKVEEKAKANDGNNAECGDRFDERGEVRPSNNRYIGRISFGRQVLTLQARNHWNQTLSGHHLSTLWHDLY